MDFIALKKGIQNFIQSCFSADCSLCHMPLDQGRDLRPICSTCDSDIPRYPLGWDLVFHDPVNFDKLECQKLSGITAIYDYQWPFDYCIQQLKFHQKVWHARTLGSFLNDQINNLGWPTFDLVCAIPLHNKRLAERGFNQSGLILEHIAETRSTEPLTALKRMNMSQPQSELSRQERLCNVNGVFACDQDLTGKTILIIDDVLTTGATLNQASQVLLDNNATAVFAAVAAIKNLN